MMLGSRTDFDCIEGGASYYWFLAPLSSLSFTSPLAFFAIKEERLSTDFRARFARITLEQQIWIVEGMTSTFLSIGFPILAPATTLYALNPEFLF